MTGEFSKPAATQEIGRQDQDDFIRAVSVAAGETVVGEEDARDMAVGYGHVEDTDQYVNETHVARRTFMVPPADQRETKLPDGVAEQLPDGGEVICEAADGVFSLIVRTTGDLPEIEEVARPEGVFVMTQRTFAVEDLEAEEPGGTSKRMCDYVAPRWYVNSGGQRVPIPAGYPDLTSFALPLEGGAVERGRAQDERAEDVKLALLAHEAIGKATGEELFNDSRLGEAWAILAATNATGLTAS